MSKKNSKVSQNFLDNYGELNSNDAQKAMRNYELEQLLAATMYELRHKDRRAVKRVALTELSKHPQALAFKEKCQEEAEKGFTILQVGQTGAGKSATVNSLFGKEVAKTNELNSETKTVTHFDKTYHGVKYSIYDTPGLGEWDDRILEFDNETPELMYVSLKLNHEYLSLMVDKCPFPDVVWYVLNLHDRRLTLEDAIDVALIQKYFGDDIWNRTMIVCTHTDLFETQKQFQKSFDDRTQKIGAAVAKVTKGKIQGIPAVAVANGKEHTPDGKSWLGRLFVTSFEQLNPERRTAFFLAFAMDLKIPKPQPPEPKYQNPNTNDIEDTSEDKGRIDLTEDDLFDRFLKVSSGVYDVLAGAIQGAGLGASFDAATGGIFMGIPTILGAFVGGFASIFLKR